MIQLKTGQELINEYNNLLADKLYVPNNLTNEERIIYIQDKTNKLNKFKANVWVHHEADNIDS
jgi:hypothetical protein